MKYTTNYNLYKPDYDDTIDVNFLNQNMDVLDNTVAGLNYVRNVNTSDKGLTFIKRGGQQIDVPLNYLPLTGGNITGELTVQNNVVSYVISNVEDTSNPSYNLRAIKYNDGTLKNIITCKANIGVTTVTFLVPFVDVDDIQVMSGRIAIGTNNTQQENMYSVAHLTTTSFQTANGANASRQQTMLIGRWK